MKGKSKSQPSAMQIANIAGCSLTLVHRKLGQGKSPREIIAEAVERERKAVRDLPVVPVNGHAATVSFAEAQRRKEHALARIREAEADQRTGALMPQEEARQWILHLFLPLTQSLRALPNELGDLLPPGMEDLLSRRIEGILGAADAYLASCGMAKPLTDGLLDCPGGYRVRWEIIPPPPEAA